MTHEVAENVRKFRRRAGLTQEELADRAELSSATVGKAEQQGTVSIETLHCLARALDIETSRLLASDAPEPVRSEEPNRSALRELRIALTPAYGLVDPVADAAESGDEPSVRKIRRSALDTATLYRADEYSSVAAQLPALIRTAEAAVQFYDSSESDEYRQALLARSEVRQLVGSYLIQIRQYDIAHTAIHGAIEDARAAEDMVMAASAVGNMCWLLLRTQRYDEAERIAVEAMDVVEPRMRGAGAEELRSWGGLAMEAAAAAARNNRPDTAREYREAAKTAATAVGHAPKNILSHWSRFGVVTTAMKALEDPMVTGDVRDVVRNAADDPALSPRTWDKLGQPSPIDANRHFLDLARAHTRTGDPTAGAEQMARLYRVAPEWLRHQTAAVETLGEILSTRKRTLTTELRDMANHLGVVG